MNYAESFEQVKLSGSDMIGHLNNINKIADIYYLRKGLYDYNTQA